MALGPIVLLLSESERAEADHVETEIDAALLKDKTFRGHGTDYIRLSRAHSEQVIAEVTRRYLAVGWRKIEEQGLQLLKLKWR
jgi:hypothetical protein